MIRTVAALAVALCVPVPAASAATPEGFAAVATQVTGKQRGKTLNFSETLRAGGKVVGRDKVSFLQISSSAMRCKATFTLTGGGLVVSGKIVYAKRASTLPIVSGTGRYKGARGSVTIREQSSTTTLQTFAFS